MKNTIEIMRNTIQQQINHGPSESAMHRLMGQLDALEKEFTPQESKCQEKFDTLFDEFTCDATVCCEYIDGPIKKSNFTPHTHEFNAYVWQKVNSEKDVRNIMDRYDLTHEEVMVAYRKGSMGD